MRELLLLLYLRNKSLLNPWIIRCVLSNRALGILKHYLQILPDLSALNQSYFWKHSYCIFIGISLLEFVRNIHANVTVSNSKGCSKAFISLVFWVRRKVTSAPESPSSPFRRPSLPFPKLSKYARGTPDRWELISLAIWPQFVFLANESGLLRVANGIEISSAWLPSKFCREICIISMCMISVEIATVHKCINIITDNACRCFHSAFKGFDTTDLGVAKIVTYLKLSQKSVELNFSVLGELSYFISWKKRVTFPGGYWTPSWLF